VEDGDEVCGKACYFLAWSMLEVLCLWALCSLMHMQSEKGRERRRMGEKYRLFSFMIYI
jgi:hypothetical protein